MAPPAPPPSAQQIQQFLSTALSQRGPASLPYSEDSKWLIRHHLLSLSDAFPSLHPQTSSFTHNDGRQSLLLNADGTIPILFNRLSYNIPATLWLLDSYPRRPPAVFLTPTHNMIVKPHHPHVDRSGSVNVPYLRNWVYPSSNLVDLVTSLSQLFSQDPPLFSRPVANSNNNNSVTPSPTPPPPRPYVAPSQSTSPYSRPVPQPQDAAEVFRRNAITKIIENVHVDTVELRKEREAEMEGLFSTQGTLRQRAEELGRGMREMDGEREGLEQQLQVVSMNVDVLGEWVSKNEGRGGLGEVDVDEVVEPADAVSRQMLESTAADLAIEDVIYALDKAVQEGVVPFDLYLKSVRGLAREQFFKRAMGVKVRQVQVQKQVASMAARAPPLYSS